MWYLQRLAISDIWYIGYIQTVRGQTGDATMQHMDYIMSFVDRVLASPYIMRNYASSASADATMVYNVYHCGICALLV